MPRSASPLFTVMRRAAEAASRQLLRDFGDVAHLQVSRKGPADFVSQADQRSEEIIKNALLHADPDSGFLAEESGKQGNQIPAGSSIRSTAPPIFCTACRTGRSVLH